MRLIFMGTPDFSVPILDALHSAGHEIVAVYCQPPRPSGRGKKERPTPVHSRALALGLTVCHPTSLKSPEEQATFAAHDAEIAVVVAYGLILPQAILDAPLHGCLNIHASLLPRWRGAAPVERAILAGDTETAIAIMSVVEGLDEGDVWALHPVPIHRDETLLTLWQSMAISGAGVLIEAMRNGFTDPTSQSGEVLYARKLTVLDRFLDWERSAIELDRIVRVGNAWSSFRGDRFKIHMAEPVETDLRPGEIQDLVVGTADGGLRLITVQPAGKPRMDAKDWANGAQPNGDRFDILGEDGEGNTDPDAAS